MGLTFTQHEIKVAMDRANVYPQGVESGNWFSDQDDGDWIEDKERNAVQRLQSNDNLECG